LLNRASLKVLKRSLFWGRTLKFLWASVPVMCGSWNLQCPNLYERSTSELRRTRRGLLQARILCHISHNMIAWRQTRCDRDDPVL